MLLHSTFCRRGAAAGTQHIHRGAQSGDGQSRRPNEGFECYHRQRIRMLTLAGNTENTFLFAKQQDSRSPLSQHQASGLLRQRGTY